jgi:hypothetical protein
VNRYECIYAIFVVTVAVGMVIVRDSAHYLWLLLLLLLLVD